MQNKVSYEEAEQIIKYLKSHLCELVFNELGPDENDIVNLESQFILIYTLLSPQCLLTQFQNIDQEKKLQQFRGYQRSQLNTFIKKYVALTNCFTISRARFKQILFLNGNKNSSNLGFDLLVFEQITYFLINSFTKFYPELKTLIQKIPKKTGFIDQEIIDRLQEYQNNYNKNNIMAFNDDNRHIQSSFLIQKSRNNNISSHSNSSTQISRNNSFVDYRNSIGFTKDFKHYLNSRMQRTSSFLDLSTQYQLKNNQQSHRSSSQSRNCSEQENNRIEKPQILVNNSSEIKQDQPFFTQLKKLSQQDSKLANYHKFSLLQGEDLSKKKTAYLKLHGKYNDERSGILQPIINKNQEIKNLKEMKTPILNPINGISQQNVNNLIVMNESQINLNSSRNLLDDSNYQTSIFFSPQKEKQEENSHQESNLSSKNQSYLIEPRKVSSQIQSKQQSGKSSKQFQQDSFQQKSVQDDSKQNELIETVQFGYNNYVKFKGGGNSVSKISIKNPIKLTRDLSNPRNKKLNSNYSKEPNWLNIDNSDPSQSYKKDYIEPFRNQTQTQNKLIDHSGINNSRQCLHTENSPIKTINKQSFEKRENLQQYFNEIVLSHSRRQDSRSNNTKGAYKLNQSFIEHCASQNISVEQLVKDRINYMKQDQNLVFFEKPAEETPIRFYNNTQLTKSLTPQKKKGLENSLFNIEKSERPLEPSLQSQGKSSAFNVNHTFFKNSQIYKKDSPKNNENIDFFAISNSILNDRTEQIENLKRLVQKQSIIKRESIMKDSTPKFFRKSILQKQPSPTLKAQQLNGSFQQGAPDQTEKKKMSTTPTKRLPYKQKYSQQQLIDMIYQKEDTYDKNNKKEGGGGQQQFKNPIFESPSRLYKNLLEIIQ